MKFLLLILSFVVLFSKLSFADDRIDGLEAQLEQENLTSESRVEIHYSLLVEYRNVLPLKGIDYATDALKIIKNNSRLDSIYKFKLLNGIGDTYRYVSSNEYAMDKYIAALKVSEINKDRKQKAIALNNIGLIYNNITDYQLALDYLIRSYEIIKTFKDKPLLIQSYNNMASIYWNDNQIDSSMKYYNLAFESSKEVNDLVGLLHSYNNLGIVHLQKGDNYAALDYFYRSLEISQNINDRMGEAKTLNNLGQVFISLEKYNTAASNLEKSLSIAQELNAKAVLADSYFYLSKLYEENKDYEKALNYHKKFNITKDSIYNVEQNRRIQKLHEEFVLQKKNSEIEILQKEKEIAIVITIATISLVVLLIFIAVLLYSKYRTNLKNNEKLQSLNNQLNESNQMLEETNASKDKIFTIIAHDLKNPLSEYKNITTVLSDYYNDMDEEEVKSSLNTIKDASNSLMLLLENLLTWAKLQKNEIENYPEKFDINYLVKKYIDYYKVKAEQKHIDIVYNNGEEVFAYADPNLVSIVVKNLISNSIKYSDKHSKVIVNIENINNKATMNITDMGIGIDKGTLEKIFTIHNDKDSRFGTEGERGTGIGLILSKSFVDMNNGDIWIESEEGKGTTVTFELPSSN